MFGKRSEAKPASRIDSLIGAGTSVEGNIRFSGGLRVDGEIKGQVEAVGDEANSMLVLSEKARIEGAVTVAHLVSNGSIVGPVTTSVSLELQSKARIIGDVSYALIEMHQGAVIEGHLVHTPSHQEQKPVELKLAASN